MAQQGIVLPFNPKQHSHLTPYLAAIHASCITQDRTIATFLPPLSHEKLLSWWKERIAEVNDGKRQIWILVTQVDESGRPKGPELMGVVMLTTPYSETGAYRGYVEKLLVHKNFRGRGGARALMAALESEATRMSKNILVSLRAGYGGWGLFADFGNSCLTRRRGVLLRRFIGSWGMLSWGGFLGMG